MTLTIGSLFSGIGGLELGLEWAGLGPTLWQVEQDAYCRAVLAKHWPDATRYEDVRHVGRDTLVPVDVLCGGFPCQDISVAGKGAGLAGERSGLWSEYARIVRELRPRYVVVENVAALLARGIGTVLGDLAALGYDAEWDCLPASAVGAPHRRDRLFVIAYAGGDARWLQSECQPRRSGPPVVGHDGAHGDVADAQGHRRLARRTGDTPQEPRGRESHRGGVRADVGHPDGPRQLQPQGRIADERRRASDASWWAVEPDVGRVADGTPARVDRLRALGNAVVPQVAEVVGRVILAREAALAQDGAA